MIASNDTELRSALTATGHRVTAPRLAVWNVVSTSDKHLTAEDIAERVGEIDPNINLSSIYRSLTLLADIGMVRESNLGSSEPSHWEVAHPDEEFHMRCRSCGRVEHHTGGDLVDRVRRHLADDPHHFHADQIDLVVTGLCQRCQTVKL